MPTRLFASPSLAALFSLSVLAACGGGSSGGGGGSTYVCLYSDPGAGALCENCTSGITECDTYSGANLSGSGVEFSTVQTTCQADNGDGGTAIGCPATNRIGCCAFPYIQAPDLIDVVDCFYGAPTSATAMLPSQCAGVSGGVWTAN